MRHLAVAALICSLSSPAIALCTGQYLADSPPQPVLNGAVELCSDAFATSWDPSTRNPRYSAEHLTAASLLLASAVERVNSFRRDDRLPPGQRSELSDYRASGYDRGHMAPDHDMPTTSAMNQSFVLSNMVPQNSVNNRGPWAQIEAATRALVVSVLDGQGWVVTGPLYSTPRDRLNGRVAVPSGIFKALYVPGDALGNETVAGAWVVDNSADPATRFVSLDELKSTHGVDAFPSLDPKTKSVASLPAAVRKRTDVLSR